MGKGLLWPRARGVLRINKDVPVVGSSAVPPSGPVTEGRATHGRLSVGADTWRAMWGVQRFFF